MMEGPREYVFVVFIVVISPFYLVNGLRGRTCQLSGITKCCEYFYDKNGVCEECPIGFETNDDQECVPCTNGFFGKRCTYRCNCTEVKTCHHVSGMCINKSPQNADEDYSNRKTDGVFYGCLCAALIVGSILSLFIDRLRKRFSGQSINIEDGANHVSSDTASGCKVPSGYQYIDEAEMVDLSCKNFQNIQFPLNKKDREIASLANQQQVKSKRYSNPYQSMEAAVSGYHRYSQISGQQNEEYVCESGYLNPYTPLEEESVRDNHDYKKCTVQHDKTSFLETNDGKAVSQTIS